MSIRIFIADDHGVVRDGLRFLLEAQKDFTVVGDAADGLETVSRVRQLCPDVVVMDIAMPNMNGIEATLRIRELCPATQVVILSMYANSEHIFRALQAGALGYVLKESAGRNVVRAVRRVRMGHRYLSHSIMETLIDDYIHQHQAGPEHSPLERLSSREREILQLVVEGKSSVEIADLLCISHKTVETYRSRVMNKLGTGNLPALVRFAIQHHLTAE